MRFEKCHGLGNDYIYVDFDEMDMARAMELAPELCARATGVGSDGIVLMSKLSDDSVKTRMVNADGSESEICGNALRSVAHLARKKGWISASEMTLETAVGPRVCTILSEDGDHAQVKVEMGFAQFGSSAIDCTQADPIELMGPEGKMVWHGVSMGNPHVVTFLSQKDFDFNKWGPLIAENEMFTKGVNVNFLYAARRDCLISRIWERGSGATLACGSGACAGFAVAHRQGLVDEQCEVVLTLGSLTMHFDEQKGIEMTGPSQWVYSGQF